MSGRAIVAVAALLMLPLVTPRIRGADEIEYFSYLPSALFDGDLEFGNEYERFHAADPEGLQGFRETFLERREPATGRHINFAPLGTALLWSPFFLLAHVGVLTARGLGATVAADGVEIAGEPAPAHEDGVGITAHLGLTSQGRQSALAGGQQKERERD